MKALQVTNVATRIVVGNPCRNFIHLFNNSDATIYVSYDGDPLVTPAIGMPILPGDHLSLNNDGHRVLYGLDVYAIHNSGVGVNKEIRIQGD